MQTIHNAVYSMLRKSFQITKKKSQNSLENQFHDSIYETGCIRTSKNYIVGKVIYVLQYFVASESLSKYLHSISISLQYFLR